MGAPAIVQAQAGSKLPLATIWPDANFHTINARQFAEEVKKATSGAVEIDVKAGGELSFTGPEQLRAVRDGLVPMADILDSQQVGDHPIMGVEGLPFLCASTDELKVLHKHLRPEFEKVALKNNQTILYMVPWPAQYLHLTIKAQSVDDLKAVKIRVPDTNARDMCNAIGMAPALIPWGETIAALSSGARVRRVDLGGIGCRWQVLGVPEILPRHQPRLVVATRHHQQRQLEEDLAHQPESDRRSGRKARADVLGTLAAGGQGQRQEAPRRRHADGRRPRADDGRAAQAHGADGSRLLRARADGGQADQGLPRRDETRVSAARSLLRRAASIAHWLLRHLNG
jgi:hypothetical protein